MFRPPVNAVTKSIRAHTCTWAAAVKSCNVTTGPSNAESHVPVQAIRVETAPGLVETALLHTAELDTSSTNLRVRAMHRRNPLHTFMFSAQGNLLNANTAALEAFEHHHKGIVSKRPAMITDLSSACCCCRSAPAHNRAYRNS